MSILISILIPSTIDRQSMLDGLIKNIEKQIKENRVHDIVEIICEIDNYELTVGAKRQNLLIKSRGVWIVYCDSDDEISDDYILEIVKALENNPDVVGFNGWMTTDGTRKENFKISKDLPYITIKDALGNNEYLRFNNHLSPTKRSIAIQIGYKDLKYAEDYDYAVRLKDSGLIKTEKYIHKDLYHYKFKKIK